MHIFQHHVRQLQTKLADVKRKTGLQYLQDKQECEVNENAYFADMRLRESVNCFDPSFSLPGLETATAHNAPSLSDNEYEEVFKQFTAFPDSEEPSAGDESLNLDTELRPINDEPLEVWPLPLPLPVPIAPVPEQPKANARTRSMMDEVVERAAKRSRTAKTEVCNTAPTSTPSPGPSKTVLLKQYPCSDCELSFARKHDLDRHMRKHTGDLPYRCYGCNDGFRRTDARDRHWRRRPECKIKDDEAVKNTKEGNRRARRMEARRMRDREATSAL